MSLRLGSVALTRKVDGPTGWFLYPPKLVCRRRTRSSFML